MKQRKTSPSRPLGRACQQILVPGDTRCDHCHKLVPVLGYLVPAARGDESRLLCLSCREKEEWRDEL
jgi:hypothetical protein